MVSNTGSTKGGRTGAGATAAIASAGAVSCAASPLTAPSTSRARRQQLVAASAQHARCAPSALLAPRFALDEWQSGISASVLASLLGSVRAHTMEGNAGAIAQAATKARIESWRDNVLTGGRPCEY
jgi:hypothetical protein